MIPYITYFLHSVNDIVTFYRAKIIESWCPKIVVGRNALVYEIFYFRFRFPKFRGLFLKNSEKLLGDYDVNASLSFLSA